MNKFKKLKVGLRTIKTAFAVSLSMFIVELLNLQSPLFAGIGAVSSMQSSVSESLISGKNRILGTIVGAIIGLIFSMFLTKNYFILAIGIIFTISINNYFGWNKSLQLACYVYMGTFLKDPDERSSYAIYRLLSTFVGIGVGTLINYFVAAPDIKKIFGQQKEEIYQTAKSLVFTLVTTNKEVELEELKTELYDLEQSFDIYKQELNYDFSHKKIPKSSIEIIRMIEEISADLNTIIYLDMKPVLNEENGLLFERIYNEDYTLIQREKDKKDIIYNYHINRTLNNLIEIESLLED